MPPVTRHEAIAAVGMRQGVVQALRDHDQALVHHTDVLRQQLARIVALEETVKYLLATLQQRASVEVEALTTNDLQAGARPAFAGDDMK